MNNILYKILCKIGFHSWEQQIPVSRLETVKSAGMHILFTSYGMQKGTQCCIKCNSTRKVFREDFVGWTGPLSKTTKWKPLYSNMEKYIDSLPNF
jgi:hypothetical protein